MDFTEEDVNGFVQGVCEDHHTFVELCKARNVSVYVDPYLSVKSFMRRDFAPGSMKLWLFTIFTLAFSSIFFSIILLFFAAWYTVLSVLLFGTLLALYGGWEATVGSLALAIATPWHYKELRDAGVFRIEIKEDATGREGSHSIN